MESCKIFLSETANLKLVALNWFVRVILWKIKLDHSKIVSIEKYLAKLLSFDV